MSISRQVESEHALRTILLLKSLLKRKGIQRINNYNSFLKGKLLSVKDWVQIKTCLWLVSIYICLNLSLILLWKSPEKKLNERRIRDLIFILYDSRLSSVTLQFSVQEGLLWKGLTLWFQENSLKKKSILFWGFEKKEKLGWGNIFHFVTVANQNPGCSSGEAVCSLAQVYSNNKNIKTVTSTKEGSRVWRISLPNLATVPFIY